MIKSRSQVHNLRIIKQFIEKLENYLIVQLKPKESLNNELIVKTLMDYFRFGQLKQNVSLNKIVGNINQNKQQIQKQNVYSSLFRTQERLLELEEQNLRIKQQRNLEFQMTANFIKLYKKEEGHQCSLYAQSGLKKSRKLFNSSKKIKSTLKSSRVIDENIEKLDFGCIEESRAKYCLTQRTNNKSGICLQEAQCYEPQQPEKLKILAKLRKLQKFVYKQTNHKKQQDKNMIFSLKQSPSKQYYREQNDNLKAIQENLNIHLQMLEKYREVPSIDNLVAREEAIKKRQKILNELEDKLQKKQKQLNRQRSQMLRKQRNWKR